MVNIENLIKRKIWEYYEANSENSLDTNGYVSKPEYNLISGIEMDDFRGDFEEGSGNELYKKFCAAHSSSALVVNTFARWRKEPSSLNIFGNTNFNTMKFEGKCSTGLKGTPPNLDILLSSDDSILGVESKFIEYLQPKKPLFSKSYQHKNLPQVEDEWWRLLEKVRNGNPQYLDIAQLIKHYLGLRYLNTNEGFENYETTLLYLFWEPENWEKYEIFINHRKEIEDFNNHVKSTAVRFVAKSYPELWKEWESQKNTPSHIDNLRSRYSLLI
tara:strand:+ start:1302 stop:2117 length:816 start_codon:yes stop_codon:yes gene_type:complete